MTRLRIPIPLRWGDLDAYNHVNNVTVFRLLEEARVRAFWKPDSGDMEFPTAIVSSVGETGVQTLIAHQEIEYLRPIPYQNRPIMVELWVSRLGGSSVEVNYEVFSPDGIEPRELHLHATTVMVMVSLKTGMPVRLTEEQRELWGDYVEEPVQFRRKR